MDSDIKAFLAIFAAAWIAIFAIAYAINPQHASSPELKPLEVYYDRDMTTRIQDNNVWWRITITNLTYVKIVYVYNPNDYNATIDIYWEAFPAEMTQYCHWGSNLLSPSIGSKELVELRLWVSVGANQFLGLSSYDGDVLTRITVVRP